MQAHIVKFTKQAEKDIARLPQHVADKLLAWARDVEEDGLSEVRKRAGYHDEPLKGQRRGQRSIRLSRSWRAIYVEHDGKTILVEVQEVTHHGY